MNSPSIMVLGPTAFSRWEDEQELVHGSSARYIRTQAACSRYCDVLRRREQIEDLPVVCVANNDENAAS